MFTLFVQHFQICIFFLLRSSSATNCIRVVCSTYISTFLYEAFLKNFRYLNFNMINHFPSIAIKLIYSLFYYPHSITNDLDFLNRVGTQNREWVEMLRINRSIEITSSKIWLSMRNVLRRIVKTGKWFI